MCTARTGQIKAVDPQYEQTIEGHKLGSVRMARPGRTTSDQQWRLNGLLVCVTRMPWICIDVCLLRRRLFKIHDVLYMALMALREPTEDSTEFTPGRRYELLELNPPCGK